ncbi:hypothetical protein GA0115256_111341 [Streptomyces sp. DconLS]|nr:hypothetical protein GA0115256_111341 [Streptomyces sp. DconLS]SCF75572.1 hypothetical protein GA0115258_111610 [Streptomyces sp. LamerLS-31b]
MLCLIIRMGTERGIMELQTVERFTHFANISGSHTMLGQI